MQGLGAYDEAGQNLQTSMKIRLKCYGERHTMVANTHFQMGELYAQMYKDNPHNAALAQRALDSVQTAWDIRVQKLGVSSVLPRWCICGVVGCKCLFSAKVEFTSFTEWWQQPNMRIWQGLGV